MLSAREVEVLLLLDEHLGTDEIAQRLFISEHTVRSHVKSLLKKLGVSSRREALERLDVARGCLALAREPLERRLDELGQRLEVVSALEHGGDARARAPRTGARARETRPRSSRISASGSSRCASKPAATSTRSGSNARTAGSTISSNAARTSASPEPAASGTFTIPSAFVPGPPVPGQNGHWCSETVSTVGSSRNIASVPFP